METIDNRLQLSQVTLKNVQRFPRLTKVSGSLRAGETLAARSMVDC